MKTTAQNSHTWFMRSICGFCLALALMACSDDSNPANPGGGGYDRSVVGRMDGNSMAKVATGVEGTVVTAFAINADGSRGQEMGRDTLDAQGNFKILTDAQGSQNWLLVAVQGNMEWMTRYCDTLINVDEDTARAMNFESTLQTRTYLELQKSGAGKKVSSGEIASAIDLNVAASNRSQFMAGNSAARDSLIAHFSAEIRAQYEARTTYLSRDNSHYAADTAKSTLSLRQAEAALNAALYQANGDSAQTRQAEKVYLQAMISAYASWSDSSAMSYSRSAEAVYHATVMATAGYVDSTRNSMRRRSLHIMAVASDTAMQRDFRRANASSAQLQAVINAGATFQNSVDTSRTDASRDSVVARYRASLRAVFQMQSAASDSSFIVFLNVSTTGVVGTATQTMSGQLQTELAADATANNASGMGEDIQTYNQAATAAIQTQWQSNTHNTGDADQNSAMAHVMAFLTVSSNSSHNGA